MNHCICILVLCLVQWYKYSFRYGAFVGVATSFNGTPQLYLRNLDGVVGMNGARCQEPVAFFTEDFSGGIPANWVNTTTTGTKNWSVASFSGVFYAQQSAFVSRR